MPHAAATAATATAQPFATLAAIILASALAGRIGAFQVLARALIPARGATTLAAAAILTFTALLSALVNLDVAVVVAMPVALQAAQRQGLPAGRLAVAVAMTANAASFLLPTSNITNLLLLSRSPAPAPAYISDSWLPWILVTAITVAPLALWAGTAATPAAHAVIAGPSARAAFDLVPMFLLATAMRALLGTGLALHGSFTGQLTREALLAATINNLPAAAAIVASWNAGAVGSDPRHHRRAGPAGHRLSGNTDHPPHRPRRQRPAQRLAIHRRSDWPWSQPSSPQPPSDCTSPERSADEAPAGESAAGSSGRASVARWSARRLSRSGRSP